VDWWRGLSTRSGDNDKWWWL